MCVLFYGLYSPPDMSKSSLVSVVLLGLSGASWAQMDAVRAEPLNKVLPVVQQATGEPQQRRAAVRAALEASRAPRPTTTDTAPRAKRQLSPKERQELRQQLRQQGREPS